MASCLGASSSPAPHPSPGQSQAGDPRGDAPAVPGAAGIALAQPEPHEGPLPLPEPTRTGGCPGTADGCPWGAGRSHGGSTGGKCSMCPPSKAGAPRALALSPPHPCPCLQARAPSRSSALHPVRGAPTPWGWAGLPPPVPHPPGTFPAAAARKSCRGGDGDLGFTPAQHFHRPHQPRHTRLITCPLTRTRTHTHAPTPAAGPWPNPQHRVKKRAKTGRGGEKNPVSE